MRNLSSAFLAGPLPPPPARPRPAPAATKSLRAHRAVSAVSDDGQTALSVHFARRIPSPKALSSTYTSLVSSASPPIHGLKARSFRPSPELGLLSILFVLSMAMGSMLCMAIVSLPAMNAFRRLAASMEDLSKVVSREVPWTLSSLKLSSVEINELTRQLSNLRQKIPGSRMNRERRREN